MRGVHAFAHRLFEVDVLVAADMCACNAITTSSLGVYIFRGLVSFLRVYIRGLSCGRSVCSLLNDAYYEDATKPMSC